MIAIAPLREDEIETLCALARTIWRAHYPSIIGTPQTEYMLAQRYDPASIAEELSRGDVWWDTLSEDGRMVAFASCLVLPAERSLKVDKLYVHPDRQRMGYGGALLDHAWERAARVGCTKLVLAVNKRNVNAIGAYRKHGFSITDAIVTDIGGGFVMDDYVMEKPVSREMAVRT